MTQSLKKVLLALPISLLLLAGCGDDGGDDTASGDNGSEASGSEEGNGSDEGDGGGGGFDDTTDLCSLVSDETLAASNLSAADGVQKEWVVDQACVYGEDMDRRIIVQIDPDNSLAPIEEGDEGVEMVDGVPVQVEWDSEMTCQLIFTSGEAKVDVIVEDLGNTEETPGEPCDAGYAALDDVIAKAA